MTVLAITPGYDTIHAHVSSLPPGQVMGYVTGTPDIVWTEEDSAAHPGWVRTAQDLSLSTEAVQTADVFDWENYTGSMAELVMAVRDALEAYHVNARPGQRLPNVYASADNLTGPCNALTKAGLANGQVGLHVANWNLTMGHAAVDVEQESGPFPIRAVQFKSGMVFDFDIFSTAWLLNTSDRHISPKPVVTEYGYVILPAAGLPFGIGVIPAQSTDGKTWLT